MQEKARANWINADLIDIVSHSRPPPMPAIQKKDIIQATTLIFCINLLMLCPLYVLQ